MSPGICQRLVLWILVKYFALYICVSNSVNPPPPIVQPPMLCPECPRAMQRFSYSGLAQFSESPPPGSPLYMWILKEEKCALWNLPLENLLAKEKVEAAWAGLLTAVSDHCRSSPPLTICSAVIDFGPDGRLISGPTYLALCYIIATQLYGWSEILYRAYSKLKSVYKWLLTIAGAHCVLP